MLFSFTTKTAFIRLLGAEYNGVSSLYTSIVSVLALAELGLGNVIGLDGCLQCRNLVNVV